MLYELVVHYVYQESRHDLPHVFHLMSRQLYPHVVKYVINPSNLITSYTIMSDYNHFVDKVISDVFANNDTLSQCMYSVWSHNMRNQYNHYQTRSTIIN